jgi:hypothetical protein
VGLQSVKTIGKIEATVSTVENINRRELGAVPHRLGILVNDILGRSGCSLLDGRIDLDRIKRNAPHLPPTSVFLTSLMVKLPQTLPDAFARRRL